MSLSTTELSQFPLSVLSVLMDGPAGLPPLGTLASDTANANIVPENTFVLVFSVGITTIALAVRLFTKARLIKKWNLEDSE